MSCDQNAQIHAYHDGELAADQRDVVERHLRDCADCAAVLSELRQLSTAIQSAPRPVMAADALRRLEQAWWRRRDRGVLRLAEFLTAAAAAVIVATVLFSSDTTDRTIDPPNRTLAWQTDALMPPTEGREEAATDVVAVAEWMANDLSPEQSR